MANKILTGRSRFREPAELLNRVPRLVTSAAPALVVILNPHLLQLQPAHLEQCDGTDAGRDDLSGLQMANIVAPIAEGSDFLGVPARGGPALSSISSREWNTSGKTSSHLGWWTFLASAIFYVVSGWNSGDTASLIGGLLFLGGCIFFMIPLFVPARETVASHPIYARSADPEALGDFRRPQAGRL